MLCLLLFVTGVPDVVSDELFNLGGLILGQILLLDAWWRKSSHQSGHILDQDVISGDHYLLLALRGTTAYLRWPTSCWWRSCVGRRSLRGLRLLLRRSILSEDCSLRCLVNHFWGLLRDIYFREKSLVVRWGDRWGWSFLTRALDLLFLFSASGPIGSFLNLLNSIFIMIIALLDWNTVHVVLQVFWISRFKSL